MKKERIIRYLLGGFIASLYLFMACDEHYPSVITDQPGNPLKPEEVSEIKWKLLKEFTFAELKTAEEGMGLSSFSLIGENDHRRDKTKRGRWMSYTELVQAIGKNQAHKIFEQL